MKIFLTIIFLVVCVALTAIVLMQEGKAAGLGSIGGLGDTYWGKNKSKSMEGTLVRVTKLLAAAFLIIALALNMIPDKSSSKNNTPVTEKATEAVTEAAAAQTEAEAVMTEAEAAVQTEAEAVMTEAEAAAQTEAEAVMTEAEAAVQTEARQLRQKLKVKRKQRRRNNFCFLTRTDPGDYNGNGSYRNPEKNSSQGGKFVKNRLTSIPPCVRILFVDKRCQ